jgi:glutamate N-acetyltransferase/amino-acid N-acetyltransferase
MNIIKGGVCAAKGFKAGGVHAGIKSSPANMPREETQKKKDLAIIYCEKLCNTAALYTTNKVQASPIAVSKKHLSNGQAQAVIVNSGNANACTANGLEVAEAMCELTAKSLGIKKEDVVVASTGVIGQELPIEPIKRGISNLVGEGLSLPSGSDDAALAIMTTDTFPKQVNVEFDLGGKTCHIGGIAKGSGMINPNMATMLSFITTDVAISSEMLDKALREINEKTFNMVSVDGDTSTNDMVCIMASGMANNVEIVDENYDYKQFYNSLLAVMIELAQEIAKDGEGATKLIECVVTEASDELIARSIAKTVISSSLLKAALGAADANWGRILCSIGYAQGDFDISKVEVSISSPGNSYITVCKDGSGVDFSEERATEILSEDEIKICINLHSGEKIAVAWGCDLTKEYVAINADYRS